MTPGPAQYLVFHREKLAEAEADLERAGGDQVARASALFRIEYNRGEVKKWEMHAKAIRTHRRRKR